MATPEEIKADQDAKASAAKAAQDAKAAEAKAAQDAKDAEAKEAKEAKEKAELAELHTWVARSMLAAHQTDHPTEFEKIDPTPAMTSAREFVAAFKAMGSHKPKSDDQKHGDGPKWRPFWEREETGLPAITGLTGTVNKDNSTVTLTWDAPAAPPHPLDKDAPVNGEVVVFDGDALVGTAPSGTSTYTTGMMLPGPHVFRVAWRGSPARSNPFSVTIAGPIVPVAVPQPTGTVPPHG